MNPLTNMTDVYDLVNTILDEEMNIDTFYLIANIMKDRREDSRAWVMLRTLFSTSYASTITLPEDFKEERVVRVGNLELQPIPFEKKDLYVNGSRCYAIDYATNTMYLFGGSSGQTVNIYYVKVTPTLTEDVPPIWPKRFWNVLAFEIAGYDQVGLDADDIFARMGPENKLQAQLSIQAMENWDSNLQNKAQNGRSDIADTESEFDLGMM